MTDKQFQPTTPRTSTLPRYMQADCGHFIAEGTPPNGERFDPIMNRWLPVYLCPECIPGRKIRAEIKAAPQHRKHAK